MVVRCSGPMREKIFGFTKNLKGKRNVQNRSYFVDPQLPEEFAAERREVNYQIAQLKKANQDREPTDRIKFQVRQGKLYVNNELQRKQVVPPSFATILNLSREDYDMYGSMEMVKSEGVLNAGSSFTAYAQRVGVVNKVADYYNTVKIWHPECDHIMMAYRIEQRAGSCDDGEFGGGLKIQKLIEERNEVNVVVFVAREHCGKNLGVKRFTYINQQAREVLNKLQ